MLARTAIQGGKGIYRDSHRRAALAALVRSETQQVTGNPNWITPSTLRTITAAMDLLQDLTRPGLRPDLCTTPPIRTLAVDDDAICRQAVALALRYGVGQPDVAKDGPEALELAARQHYDVVFLDVEMPGMHGFELCSKIHETNCNRTTPVVFVTIHNDFNSRTRSSLSGGNELIGKPFPTFEITVKALTLALRSRLHAADFRAGPADWAPAEELAVKPVEGDSWSAPLAVSGFPPCPQPAEWLPPAPTT